MKDFYNENFKTLKKETKTLDSRMHLFAPGWIESALLSGHRNNSNQLQHNDYQNANVILQRTRGKIQELTWNHDEPKQCQESITLPH